MIPARTQHPIARQALLAVLWIVGASGLFVALVTLALVGLIDGVVAPREAEPGAPQMPEQLPTNHGVSESS